MSFRHIQARFYVGAGGNSPKAELCPFPQNLWLQQQYAVVNQQTVIHVQGTFLGGWSG